jgi:UDP-N-acetylmuramyl tripeptide synthase
MAGKKADIVIVTDEDPYDEDPREIIDQVAAGAIESGKEEGKNL